MSAATKSGWREAARAVREADPTLSYTAIAEAVGVHVSQVWRLFNPAAAAAIARRDNARRNAAKREWDRTQGRGKCQACGGYLGPNTKHRNRVLCRACWRRERTERQQERRERIKVLWDEGHSYAEIAANMESTPGSISVEVVRMRRDGWDMPRRGPGGRMPVAPSAPDGRDA